MRSWRFSANAGFFGLRRDRFTAYQPSRSPEEKIRGVAAVDGMSGIELKYPFDFEKPDRIKELLAETGLALAAVNVDIKDAAHFRFGALSARERAARDKAAALLTEGMDLAAEFGCDLVSTCPLADGFDYPFQVDYADAWGRFIETVSRVCRHRSDVRLALEYQPHEPHAMILLNTVGAVLHVCAEVDAPNLGANLDVGHSFAALESPAQSATLLAGKGRLFYLHASDNTGDGGDWDMLSGSVHFWHWLEFLLTLDRMGYDGWIGADIMAKFATAEDFYATNVRMIRRMIALIDRVGAERLAALVGEDGRIPEIYDLITAEMARR